MLQAKLLSIYYNKTQQLFCASLLIVIKLYPNHEYLNNVLQISNTYYSNLYKLYINNKHNILQHSTYSILIHITWTQYSIKYLYY